MCWRNRDFSCHPLLQPLIKICYQYYELDLNQNIFVQFFKQNSFYCQHTFMRKIFLFILSAVITFSIQAQNDNKVVIGKIDSVYYKILNEQRKIWVYTPDMTSGNLNQRYPVVYLLDGD